METFLHFQRRIGITDTEAAGRHFEIFRDFNVDAMRVDIDGGRTVDGFGDQLKGTPAAGISRHRPTVETKIQEFLYTGRIQDGDHRIHECVFGLMRCRR